MKHKNPRRTTWRTCPRCRQRKPTTAFYREDPTLCRSCRDASGGADATTRGVTIRLGAGGRVLRVRILEDVVVVTQGYRLARTVEPAVSPVSKVHIPLTRLKAVTAALARVALT
jgi:hypothetical protein